MAQWLMDIFWSERFWLAEGVTWADVTNGPDKKVLYPEVSDFLYQIPLVACVLLSRYATEKYWFAPLGIALGIKVKRKRQLPSIPLLEVAYRRSANIKDVAALAKQLDMSERQVERWWRLRRSQDKPSDLAKFCEHCWKSTILLVLTSYGLYFLWDKDYFWDLDKCYIGYPHHGVTNDTWWMHMLFTAYNLSITITFFRDVKRKDFWIMFAHHVMTSSLCFMSWMTNTYRAGHVLLPILDSCEILLEAAKAAKRAKHDVAGRILFIMFTPMWFYTRLYFFPILLYSTSVRGIKFINIFYAGIIQNVFLFLLLFISVYWSYLILLVLYNFVFWGIERDIRSSSSEISDDGTLSDSCDKNGIKYE